MASPSPSPSARFSAACIQNTVNWALTQNIPTDIIIKVGEETFPLHKFMLVTKSGYIEKKVMESEPTELEQLDLSKIPGGPEAFEKVAKFCYGINFEISLDNVVALRCAAEFLEMTEDYGWGNLADRTELFFENAAIRRLTGALSVLRSCEGSLWDMAEKLNIVQRCVEAISSKVCTESRVPTRSPPDWWATELTTLQTKSFIKTLAGIRAAGADPQTLATAIAAYAHHNLTNLTFGNDLIACDDQSHRQTLIESLVAALPPHPDAPLPAGLLCGLRRAATAVGVATGCCRDLEHRIAAELDEVTVNDLLALTLDQAGDRIADLDVVRRIIDEFVDREIGDDNGVGVCSAEMQIVARTVDAFVGEIATDDELSVSKFVGIAGALPTSARRFDDDIYRAVDIFLKAHPGIDEIEREKVCSVMDPLKLSYEARLHASQNKRLPLQIVLHALYYDQLKLRSGIVDEPAALDANVARKQVRTSMSLMRENEALKSELAQMKNYVSDMQKGQGSGGAKAAPKKLKFFSSMSRTLGKLNPFKHGSKDTSHIEDNDGVDLTKPRKRRFSIS